ncbi:T9SS type A sorting domain-containing protein [Halalkalibaculum sp. DA3122]|uniref:T9SS type A sorting domain-containing protein n=1 Tax=Halalkalibaculum sp. DA3122 TaxID=3373607 RepID=UPI00375415A3
MGGQAVLIEQETGRSYELNAGRKTEITPGAQTTSYVLVIGNDRYIEDQQKQYLPSKIEVSPNYPNPFNPATTLSFTLPRQNMVSLKVYDVIGRNIATLIEEVRPAGVYQVRFDASGQSSGVYFAVFEIGNRRIVQKMMLIK